MLLLPATCPPSRKERAAFTKFVGCVRRARATEVMYLPRWCASTLIAHAPVIEAVPDDYAVEKASIIYDLGLMLHMGTTVVEYVERSPRISFPDYMRMKGLEANVC
jgi:hypothetical protein